MSAPSITAAKAPLLALAATLLGGWTGRHLLDSANDPSAVVRATLAAHPDPLPTTPRPPPRRLSLALIDGLGERDFGALLDGGHLGPGLAWRARVDVGTPSLSRPVYHALLTGLPQRVSGIQNNAHQGAARADTLADRVRTAGGQVSWALAGVPWFHDLAGTSEDRYALVNGVLDAHLDALRRGTTLAVLHLTEVDHAGHRHGGASGEYRAAALHAAHAVRALREATSALPDASRTLWFVGADHGHRPQGGHGGPEPSVRFVTWAMFTAEPHAVPARVPGTVPVERLAATFASALGVPPPLHALGAALALPGIAAPVPSSALPTRRASTLAALRDQQRARHRRGLLGVALALPVVGSFLALTRRVRALLGAAAVSLGALVALVASAWPDVSLSAIVTHEGFVSRGILSALAGALALWPLARRLGASDAVVLALSSLPPLVALGLTGGSLGAYVPGDVEALLLPATGLIPPAVVLAFTLRTAALRALGRSSLAPRVGGV